MLRLTIALFLFSLVSCDRKTAEKLGRSAGAAGYEASKTTEQYLKGAVSEGLKRKEDDRRETYQGFPGHFDK